MPLSPQKSADRVQSRNFQPSKLDYTRTNGLITPASSPSLHPYLSIRPLRLTEASSNEPSLKSTIAEILELPNVATLEPTKRQVLVEFIVSFFSPVSYWNIRNTMCKIVIKRGFLNNESRYESINKEDMEENSSPACLESFVARWRKAISFI